jgi:glycolate oxidase FAD binding subunit
MGSPRDIVLGLEFVDGAGRIIRSGGRVVKNVAGFDITRLVVGSWGTLGVITEVTVRLRARPQHTRTVVVAAPAAEGELNQLAWRIRAWPFTPLAAEVINGRLAARLGLEDKASLLVRMGGNAKSVQGQVDIARGLGVLSDADESIWEHLRMADASARATWRWSQLPSQFGHTWAAAREGSRHLDQALLHGQPLRGLVRVIVSGTDTDLARAATRFEGHGTTVIERLPPGSWSHVRVGTVDDQLSRGIRGRFDPDRVLNAGILGELE